MFTIELVPNILARASVKTRNCVALASLKTLNGLN